MKNIDNRIPIGPRGFTPSIRAALIVALAFAIAPALIIIVWTGLEHGSNLTEHARLEAQRQADAFAEIQTRMTDTSEQVLATIAALPAVRRGDNESTTTILRSVHRVNSGYLNFTLVNTNGIVTSSSRLAPGTDLSQRDHVRRTLAEKRFSAGQYFLNLLDASPSIAFSYPVYDTANNLNGVLSVSIKLDSYDPLFDRLDLPENSFLGLVDRNGIRLYFHPPKSTNPIGRPIKESVWKTIRSSGDQGTFTDIGSDGIRRFFSFKALKLANKADPYMYVVYGIPNRVVTLVSESILIRNLVIMAVAALFALSSAILLSQRLFGSRLSNIIATTARIRDGDLGARCSVAEDASDLGQIAKALNTMAETIQRRESEAVQYARSLAGSIADKDILIKEIHHRVKNNLQLVLSLIHLQDDASADPAAFKEKMENRIASMAVVHEMLYESETMNDLDLGAYAGRLLDLVTGSFSEMVIVKPDMDIVFCGLDKAISFGLLLNELVHNAFKHAFKHGRYGTLSVSLKNENGSVRFDVCDDGPGLPDGFSINESSSLGLRLVQALAEQLDGVLSWGNNGPGARFTVVFPTSTTRSSAQGN